MPKSIKWVIFWDLIWLWDYEYIYSWKRKVVKEKVRCKCWKEYFTRRDHLLWWRINNCWCASIERTRLLWKAQKKHWMEGTVFYRKFRSLLSRCNNKKSDSYKRYWWRWISCEWKKFEDFYADMYETYIEHCNIHWAKNTTIDRIDVNGNYNKENCRWVWWKQQARNKTNNIKFIYKWKKYLLCELNEKFWFKDTLIRDRLKRGWSLEDAIEKPILRINK